jgi:type IV pilus assembly protein PilX
MPIMKKPSPQRGIVLIVALVILAVMTLGGLGLMRSMETATMVAGNISFQQDALLSSDVGLESAICWLEGQTDLDTNNPTMGYTAFTIPNETLPDDPVALWQYLDNVYSVYTLAHNLCISNSNVQLSNTVAFSIQRLCNAGNGICINPSDSGSNADGENQAAGEDTLDNVNTQVFYRITVKITGAKNTTSYVQAIVDL